MKINELEDLLGVSRATIRYYEDQGLVLPPRAENGYRDYGDEEVQLFQKIIVLRKLGVGVPEIRELIEDKTDLHDVLDRNMERLRDQQNEIESAIEMCRQLENEADDFASIDPPKYLRHIYEAEQNGEHFAEAGEISFRQLNLSISLLGALGGMAIPQNKLFSERSNDPVPDDIRGNKKDGDEYDTIGDVLRKGGKRKAVLIAVAVLFVVLLIINGMFIWGIFGGAVDFIFDYNKSGITFASPDEEEIARIKEIDPEAFRAYTDMELLHFHTQGGLLLTLKVSKDGTWTDFERKSINAEEGYLYITGSPSSKIELHVIAGDKRTEHIIEVGDSTFEEEDAASTDADQLSLDTEQAISLFYRDYDTWAEVDKIMNNYWFSDILKEAVPDGCYAITAQSIKR